MAKRKAPTAKKEVDRKQPVKAPRNGPAPRAPIGYVRTKEGQVVKDPDPRVQEAILRIFHGQRQHSGGEAMDGKNQPPQSQSWHQGLKGIVYRRQSSKKQKAGHTGSPQVQQVQAESARHWGWTEKNIEIIKEDTHG